jgi:hypothetical protein
MNPKSFVLLKVAKIRDIANDVLRQAPMLQGTNALAILDKCKEIEDLLEGENVEL